MTPKKKGGFLCCTFFIVRGGAPTWFPMSIQHVFLSLLIASYFSFFLICCVVLKETLRLGISLEFRSHFSLSLRWACFRGSSLSSSRTFKAFHWFVLIFICLFFVLIFALIFSVFLPLSFQEKKNHWFFSSIRKGRYWGKF